MLRNYEPTCIVTIKMATMLIKIKFNFLFEHCYKKRETMHILIYAVLDYIDNLPVLFVINLFNILYDVICLHTCCQTLFIVG